MVKSGSFDSVWRPNSVAKRRRLSGGDNLDVSILRLSEPTVVQRDSYVGSVLLQKEVTVDLVNDLYCISQCHAAVSLPPFRMLLGPRPHMRWCVVGSNE